jgi:hypothetical protein
MSTDSSGIKSYYLDSGDSLHVKLGEPDIVIDCLAKAALTLDWDKIKRVVIAEVIRQNPNLGWGHVNT